MKCEICGKEILRDSQCINYKYYHNDCIENLQHENKQLKECYCNRTDCSGRIKDSKVYDSLFQKVETQQKEFIKYLEDKIKKKKDDLEKLCELYKIPKENNAAYKFAYSYINKMEEILQKYKEIIGDVKNENNNI